MTQSKEPVAWEAPGGLGIARFISDSRYRLFTPGVQRHYKPYKCASCTDHAAALEAAKQEGRREGLEEAAKVWARECGSESTQIAFINGTKYLLLTEPSCIAIGNTLEGKP